MRVWFCSLYEEAIFCLFEIYQRWETIMEVWKGIYFFRLLSPFKILVAQIFLKRAFLSGPTAQMGEDRLRWKKDLWTDDEDLRDLIFELFRFGLTIENKRSHTYTFKCK